MNTPIPPQPSRADILGQLKRERWYAVDAGETARVAQLDRQIAQLSAAGTAAAPARETTAADRPQRGSAARTNAKTTGRKTRVSR